ncbi:hypothetical protein GCM10009760_29280 [Kitasatospora kazusensis]|uniref:Uncharacterized protein n=1 Tax=Kitasatospora kazusensis TaxID=407974 RepID=A0ABN2ZJI5_9ACTN
MWGEFLREFEKNNAVREPSAAERARLRPEPQPESQLRGRKRLILALLLCLTAAAGAMVYRFWPAHAAGKPSVVAAPTTAATTTAPTAVPLMVFPAQVQGYTRVADIADKSCTGTDTVGVALAGMITQSHGCLGVDLALYKDAANNEYSLAVFTMKDAADAAAITTKLAANPMDDEVAVQLPPKGSGLRELPADSGLVQAFAGVGPVMVVGMAQWSDGHSGDFQHLEDQLAPLMKAVTHAVPS